MKIIRNGGEALFSDVVCADTFARRFLGLMPRRELKPSEGLLLTDCGRIHTNFMRFTIDVVYLSGEYSVLEVETVRPWRLGKRVRGAKHVLEVAEHRAGCLKIGELISTEE